MLVEQILYLIEKEEKSKTKSSPLRMSASGHCTRQIAYAYHGFEAEPLAPRAIMVFRLGDKIETEIKDLLIKYPPENYEITTSNDEISFEIDGHKILGHVDGIIKSPIQAILEIKSVNTLRFKSLDREGIPSDYIYQATAYMKATGLDKTLFIFYNKDTSHMKELELAYDPSIWKVIEDRFRRVINSNKDNLPDQDYGPSSLGKLPWQCSYCSFNKHCWPNADLTFDKQGKPGLFINPMKGN